MKPLIILIFSLFTALNGMAQIGNLMDSGFRKGFKDTCDDAGFQAYSNYGDSRECLSTNLYVNDKDAELKLYNEGYRCGVQQATKFIENWKSQQKSKQTVNTQTNYQAPQPVTYPDVNTNINIDKSVKDYNYDNSRPATNYGTYIDPINTDLMVKAISYDNNSNGNYRPVSAYEQKKRFVNQMLYKYDEKWLNKSVKEVKKQTSDSERIGKELRKKQDAGKVLKIGDLSDGWYKVISSADMISYRTIEVKNHNVVSWINGNNIKFPVTGLRQPHNLADYYNISINLPDGKNLTGNFYITDGNPIKAPNFHEPAIYIIYTRNKVDETLYTRIFNDDFNELRGTETNWTSSANPKCNDEYGVIRFIVPLNQSFEFHSNTRTSFWKGKLTADSPCKSLVLN